MTNILEKYPNINKLAPFEKDELIQLLFKKSIFDMEPSDISKGNSLLENIESELFSEKPFAYILGFVKFQNISLLTPNGKVLIPRPETEELCDLATKIILKKYPHKAINMLSVLEVGTGSGFISIYLKKQLQCEITAIDISTDAYQVAKRNFAENNVEISLVNTSIEKYETDQLFDIIISNPPYIPITYKRNISKSVKNYEPPIALFAENNGLKVYFDILNFSISHLKPNGIIFFEVFSKKQAIEIIRHTNKLKIFSPKANFEILKDMYGKYRFLIMY